MRIISAVCVGIGIYVGDGENKSEAKISPAAARANVWFCQPKYNPDLVPESVVTARLLRQSVQHLSAHLLVQ